MLYNMVSQYLCGANQSKLPLDLMHVVLAFDLPQESTVVRPAGMLLPWVVLTLPVLQSNITEEASHLVILACINIEI